MTMLSKYLSVAEFERSETAKRLGIINKTDVLHVQNAQTLALNVYDKIREQFGPIFVSSGYRSVALNSAVPGSSKTSDHCFGRALDLVSKINGVSNKDIFLWCKSNLVFKQLIWELGDNNNPAWVHISYDKANNKKEVLKASKNSSGLTVYAPF